MSILWSVVVFSRGLLICRSATQEIAPSDKRLVFEGRWSHEASKAKADWPNTAINFQVHGAGSVEALLDGGTVRGGTKIGVSYGPVGSGNVVYNEILVGTQLIGYHTYKVAEIPSGTNDNYIVSLTKLTEASFFPELPLGAERSTLTLAGLKLSGSVSLVEPPSRLGRRIEVIGDSDTTAWGTEDFLNVSSSTCIENWVTNQNCGMSWAADLARSLRSELQVVATMGKGIYANADTLNYPSGPPMPGVYNRTLAVEASPAWEFSTWAPDLVLIRLGTNDYSRKEPPSVPVFVQAYIDFIRTIFTVYHRSHESLIVVNVCGGGYPSDAGRNYVCPTIKQVTDTWQKQYSGEGRVEYVEIPAGITSDSDRGCMDHPRVAGHAKIAKYMEPKIRAIAGWTNSLDINTIHV